MPATPRLSPPRIPALDGVRALAVLAVLADHAGIPGLHGGFMGVDIFFVLSGFLITSLLLDEQQRTGRSDLPAFWARRARRLLPAALVMIATVVALRRLFLPDAIGGLRLDALTAALWTSNWRFATAGTNYFATGGTASPLQHTWSLGVEEQFYALWPLLLALLWFGVRGRSGRRVRLLALAIGGVVLSALATIVMSRHGVSGRVYFGTDTRAQELLVGAALAALLAPTWAWLSAPHRARVSPQVRRLRGLPAALALAGVLVLAYEAHAATGTPAQYRSGLMLIVSLASAALIAGVVLGTRGVVSQVLTTPVLVLIGRISYGVYLWHWPIFEIINGERTGQHGYRLALARVAVTFAVALVSYVVIEQPVRRTRTRPARLVPAVAAAITTVLVVTMVTTPAGQTQLAGAQALDAPPALNSQAAKNAVAPGRVAVTHIATLPAGSSVNVDLFGDSIAWTLAHYSPQLPQLNLIDHATLGCGIAQGGPYRYFGNQYADDPTCDAWPITWAQQVQHDRPAEVILMVGRWETMDRYYDGAWTHVGDPSFDAYLGGLLDQAINLVGSTGARVVVSTEPYNRRGEQPDGSLYPEDDPARVTRWNQIVRARVAAHQGVKLLDLGSKLCPDGVFTWSVDGVTVRSDGVHVTPAGAAWLAPWLTDQLITDLR